MALGIPSACPAQLLSLLSCLVPVLVAVGDNCGLRVSSWLCTAVL